MLFDFVKVCSFFPGDLTFLNFFGILTLVSETNILYLLESNLRYFPPILEFVGTKEAEN